MDVTLLTCARYAPGSSTARLAAIASQAVPDEIEWEVVVVERRLRRRHRGAATVASRAVPALRVVPVRARARPPPAAPGAGGDGRPVMLGRRRLRLDPATSRPPSPSPTPTLEPAPSADASPCGGRHRRRPWPCSTGRASLARTSATAPSSSRSAASGCRSGLGWSCAALPSTPAMARRERDPRPLERGAVGVRRRRDAARTCPSPPVGGRLVDADVGPRARHRTSTDDVRLPGAHPDRLRPGRAVPRGLEHGVTARRRGGGVCASPPPTCSRCCDGSPSGSSATPMSAPPGCCAFRPRPRVRGRRRDAGPHRPAVLDQGATRRRTVGSTAPRSAPATLCSRVA